MQYYGLFDEAGNRITSYVEGLHNNIPVKAIPITEEQQKQLVDGTHVWSFELGDTVPKPGSTPEEQEAILQGELTAAIQAHMDDVARAKGYDNLLSAVSYADEPSVPAFQAEGIAFRTWRSQVWAYCYEQLTAAKAGARAIPTEEEIVAELPILILPN